MYNIHINSHRLVKTFNSGLKGFILNRSLVVGRSMPSLRSNFFNTNWKESRIAEKNFANCFLVFI